MAALVLLVLIGGVALFMYKGELGGGPSDEETAAELSGGTFTPAGPGKERYTSSQFNFNMEVPEGYTITSLEDGEGRSLLVRPDDGGEDFQITVTPFDEEGPLTPERVSQDLPDMAIRDPQQVVIASGAVTALIFKTDSDVYKESREVWFVTGGNLYQLSAPVNSDPVIGPMLESMRFESAAVESE